MARDIDLHAFDLIAKHVDDEMSADLRHKVKQGQLELDVAIKRLRKAADR